MKTRLALLALGLAALTLSGCGALIKTAGILTGDQTLMQAGDSMQRADREFTEEEKYYTGRTVACQLLGGRRPSSRLDLEAYVGRVGQTVALASGKPQIGRGWHFILAEGEAPEAFSCPGGFVIVSEGLVKLCSNEDELAAVLAHECEHLALDHPMQAISAANRKAAFTGLAEFGISRVAKNNHLENLTGTFDQAVRQVAVCVAHGYDRDKEYEADRDAVGVLEEVGYDPRALSSVLRRMPSGGAVHGDPAQRAAAVDKAIAALDSPLPSVLPARTQRFKQALAAD